MVRAAVQQLCFAAHSALRGSDLNTSYNPAHRSVTAAKDWEPTRLLISDTSKTGVHYFDGLNVRGRMAQTALVLLRS